MPYIRPPIREEVEFPLKVAINAAREGWDVGTMNYFITRLVCEGLLGPEPSYADFNGALGLLEAVKLELYRRGVAPYEDKKAIMNGEVYPQAWRMSC